MEASHDYRRWAFESAALDLALRQAGRSLADAVGREPRPVTFVSSMRFGDPPSIEPLQPWREAYPGLRFKLDPTSDWSEELIAELAEPRRRRHRRPQGPVQGHRRRPAARSRALPARGRGVPRRLDRGPGRDRRDAADPGAARGPRDLGRAHPFRPGHRERTVAAADDQHQAVALRQRQAAVRGVRLLRGARHRRYGGGQWELGPGRGHIQYLASLFHPDTPNDVAPGGYNAREPHPGCRPLRSNPRRRRPASAGASLT